MQKEWIAAGTLITRHGTVEGYVCVRDGIIREIGSDMKVDADARGIVAPCFVNAHTHIGDSVIKDPELASLDELVRPPDGLKHRVLAGTPQETLVNAMRATIRDMLSTGTCAFSDFREGGVAGIEAMRAALSGLNVHATVLGRGGSIEDIGKVLGMCDGIGLSGANDMDRDFLLEASALVKKSGGTLAIHAGEKDATDIGTALELEPDFVVHMTHAGERELKKAADMGIPVVVCPRSNAITGAGMPPVRKMLELGVTVAVGTDNVMLNSTNMFQEMEFLSKLMLHDDRQVYNLCTLNGANVLGLDTGCIEVGRKAAMMILDSKSDNLTGTGNPLSSLIRRARPDDIIAVMRDGVESCKAK